ncbi:MAG: methyltransferase domain-containing protein [Acidiferrobacterales bacterium]
MLKQLYRNVRYHLFASIPESRHSEKKVKDRIRKIRYNLFGHLPILGRRRSHGETHKARERREREHFFECYCQGQGLDIGYGGDPVVAEVTGWDFEHGDAQYLQGLEDESFDFVYSSHLLEHLTDCGLALRNWWRVLKPGGFLILLLPHRDLYEKKVRLPSRFNDDHKHFFLPDRDDPPDTIGLVPLLNRTLADLELIYCKTCDKGYVNPGTELPSEGEFSIEAVARKASSSGA